MHIIELPEDYALVMQQINEDGEDDFSNLAETLNLDRPRLAHIIESLQHKGLVSLQGNADYGFWVRLSNKGTRLMNYVWPESNLRLSY